MADAQPRTSFRSILKQLDILPVPWQYIVSWKNLIIKSQENFQTNSSTYGINKRNKRHFQRPHANLTFFQKSMFYVGIRIFNSLPCSLIIHKNEEGKLKVA